MATRTQRLETSFGRRFHRSTSWTVTHASRPSSPDSGRDARIPGLAAICLVSGLLAAALTGPARATTHPPTATSTGDQIITFDGTARDRDGAVVYLERHQLTYMDGVIQKAETLYMHPTGEVFAVLASDYSRSRLIPTYDFRDDRNGRVEGLRWQDDRLIVYRQKGAGEPLEERELDPSERLVGGQGFNNLIIDRLGELRAGEKVEFRFVIPDRLGDVGLRIRNMSRDAPGERDVVLLECEIDNWFLRLIAPSLRVEYDADDGRLLAYEGNSNLASDDGDAMHVRIEYDHGG